MKLRQIIAVVTILLTFLIVSNLVLLFINKKVVNYENEVANKKADMIFLGNELLEKIRLADHYFYDAYRKDNHCAEDSLIALRKQIAGITPRPANALLYPSQEVSYQVLLNNFTTTPLQKREVNEALAYSDEFLDWMMQKLKEKEKGELLGEYRSWMLRTTEKQMYEMIEVAVEEINFQQQGAQKISERLSQLIIYLIIFSGTVFLLFVAYAFTKWMKPYLANVEKLEKLNQQMWRTANVVFWEWDPDKNCLKGGLAFAQFFGYNSQRFTITIDEILTMVSPEDHEEISGILNNGFKKRTRIISFEVGFTDRFGEHRFARLLAEFHYDDKGRITRQHGIIQDITLQKQAEKDLEINRDRLDDILQKLEIGMAEVIPLHEREGISDLLFENINGAFCKILNVSYLKVKGKSIYEVFPKTNEAWLRLMTSEIQDSESTLFKTIYDKELKKWFNIKVYRESAQKLVVFIEDVTNDQNLKLALKKNQERLTLSEQMARLGYCEFDLEKDIVFGNENTWEIHGLADKHYLELEDLIGLINPDDRDMFREKLDKISRQSKVDIVYRVKVDGRTKYIHCVLESVQMDNNKFSAFGFVHDITSVKQVEIELRKAKEKAEESERLKSAFLANMSHEIRTPLSAIVGFAGILAKNPDISKADREECNTLIDKNSKSLMFLINDIVELSKIESGEINISPTQVEINSFLEEIHRVFAREIAGKGLNHLRLFMNKTIEGTFNILADGYRLAQVMNNLVANAIKFTNKGFVEMGYELNGDSEMVMYVRDSGIGIEKEKQDLIFDVFRQEDLNIAGRFGGTGLGLAISKRLVELMGGKIWVESVKGVGATFFFTVPISSGDLTKHDKPELSIKKGTIPKLTGKNILVADDEDFIHVLFRNFIQPTGASVISAYNGEQVLDLFSKGNKIDLVLLDMRMPKLNGMETIKRIRDLSIDVPVIAQTAYAFTGDKERFMEAGCNDYLSKPVDEDELIELIARFLA